MPLTKIKEQLLEGCSRLASKGFLNTPTDSFSLRIPGSMDMVLVTGMKDWRQINLIDMHIIPFSATGLSVLHGCIYLNRGDVGAVVISSPKGVRLLAKCGGSLPPIFDEQVRHIGSSGGKLEDQDEILQDAVAKAFKRGANAAVLGEQLICMGMTRDRVLYNTELYEKCAQAYVIANACDTSINRIPLWVRLIANRRLLKDEGVASASYREGRVPDDIKAY